MTGLVRLNEIVRVARDQGASDAHLRASTVPFFRIDGELVPQPTVALTSEEMDHLTSLFLNARARMQLQTTGDVTVRYRATDESRLRVHAYVCGGTAELAIRFLARETPELHALGLPPVVGSLSARSRGLVLFCGPTGSGKSTALAALIDRINRSRACRILCIEDPIEYEYCGDKAAIVQREIGMDAPDFASAVTGALRSDPDVILVGEMRDPQTMLAVMTAAETGHLVLTTLHTGDAPQAIERIVGAFDADRQSETRMRLAQVLEAVICLRLLPRATGKGRCCAAEILLATDAVRTLIRDSKIHQLRNLIVSGRQFGMQTLEVHLTDLIARGEIAESAARNAAPRASELIVRKAGA